MDDRNVEPYSVAALVSATVAFLLILGFVFDIGDAYWQYAELIFVYVLPVLLLSAVVCGIIGIYRHKKKPELYTGMWMAVSGLVAAAMMILVLGFLIWGLAHQY